MKTKLKHYRILLVASGFVLLTAIILKPRAQRDYKQMEMEQKEAFEHSPYINSLHIFKLF